MSAEKKSNNALKIVASVGVSAVFVWLTLRNTDLSNVWVSLKAANYLYLLPYVAMIVAIHFIRVVRWGILLEPLGKPTFKKLNSAGAIGFMALVILPFRLGEFARPMLIAERGKIRRSAAMASVVVERVVDGLCMAIVLIVAMLFAHPATHDEGAIRWARVGGLVVFAAFFGLLVFLVLAYLKRDLAVGLVRKLASPISQRLADRGAGMLDAFIGALKLVPDRRKVLVFLLLTVLYWGINGAGMIVLARGFGLELGVTEAFAVLGILVVGVMIPAGPGMLGTFQGAVILGMQLFFPGKGWEGAVQAFAWVLWAAQFSQQVGFGLLFLGLGHIPFSSLLAAGADDDEPPSATGPGDSKPEARVEPAADAPARKVAL